MRGFAVGKVHRPGDLGVGIGDLVGGAIIMVGEDSKARRLPFDAALGIFESACRCWVLTNSLRPYEELVGAVANPGDADCGMNSVHRCHDPPGSAMSVRASSQEPDNSTSRCAEIYSGWHQRT
jgi:hypothetical protein